MNPSCLCHDQLIVDGDKRPPHLILADADALSHKDEKWEKKPDHHPADFLIEEEVLPPEDGEQQGQPAADQKSDDRRENNSHDQGQTGMDVGETDVGDEPQSHGGDDQGAASQQKEEAAKVSARIRGMDPKPGAYTLCEGQEIKLFASTVIDRNRDEGSPGQVLGLKEECLVIGTGRGTVGIRELQYPGKNRLPAKDFLRGFSLPVGAVLGQ